MSLTPNAVMQMMNQLNPQRPIVQIIDIKKINSPQGERYRLIMSDGSHYMQAMLATQICSMVTSSQLQTNSIVQLDEYLMNTVQGRTVAIVLRASTIQHSQSKIGNPQSCSGGAQQPPQQPMGAGAGPGPGAGGANMANAPPQQPHAMGGGGVPRAPMQSQHRAQAPPTQPRVGGFMSAPGGGGMMNDQGIQPVSTLNPYQSNWKIKVRCTQKGPMRQWNNARGTGKLFSVELMDKEGGEIQATMFNEAADKLWTVFEPNHVYLISGGVVKLARKQFTHIKNDYSLTLNTDANVVPCPEDGTISRQQYSFVKINDLKTLKAGSYVDIIGIVTGVRALDTVTSQKTQKQMEKRTLVITDDTASVEITLWNDSAKNYDENRLGNHPIVAFRGARISEFGGVSLSQTGPLEISPPDLYESTQLRSWFNQNGGDVSHVGSITTVGGGGLGGGDSPRKLLSEITQEGLGLSDKPDYFKVVATVTNISHSSERPPWYKAAPVPEAKGAKVVESGSGQYYCAKTNSSYDTYVARFIVRFELMDMSGRQWVSAFNEVSEKLLHTTATECDQMILEGRGTEFENVFRSATFQKAVFKCRAQGDTYQDERRVRITVLEMEPLDVAAEIHEIHDRLNALRASQGKPPL